MAEIQNKLSPDYWDDKKSKTAISYLVILICWFIFIYPSVFNSQWAFLDDPQNLYISQNLFTDKDMTRAILLPNAETGRYFPIYYIVKYAVYGLVGVNPFGFYLFHSFTFLLAGLLIFWLSKSLTKENFPGILAVILCFSGSAMAENVFTLGKAEPLLLIWTLLLVFLFIKTGKTSPKFFCLIGTLLVSVSFWTKETTIVVFVFGAAYLMFSYMHYKLTNDRQLIRPATYLTLTILSGYIISRIPHLFVSASSKTYTSYPITIELVSKNLKYYLVQQPDVLLIGLIATTLFLMDFTNAYKNKFSGHDHLKYIIASMLLMGWAYIAGLLIWRWPMGYYYLVPSIIFNMVLGITLISYLKGTKTRRSKAVLAIILSIVVFLKIYSLSYFHYISTTQRSQDQIFMEVVNLYSTLGKPGERLLVENWEFYTEQVKSSNIFINNLYGKTDLKVEGIRDLLESREIPKDILNLYGVQDIPQNIKRWPQKRDLVLVLTGEKPAHWNLRGIAPVKSEDSVLQKLGYELELLSSKEISNKGLFYDISLKKITFKDTYLGYKLYRVDKSVPSVVWQGRYSDGWVGKTAKLIINPRQYKNIHLETYTALPDKTTKLQVYCAGQLVKEIEEITNQKTLFEVNIPEERQKDDAVELIFLVSDVFVPKDLGLNDDTRELGLLLNISHSQN
ncbi:MAG: hypothetical protein ACOY35_06815 [Bacillota bacterium]